MGITVSPLEGHHVGYLRDSWMRDVASIEDLPVSAYERGIAWIEDVHAGHTDTQNVSQYGVFDHAGNILAVFDLIKARPHLPGGFFKILSMMTSPTLDLNGIDDEREPERWNDAIKDIANAVTSVIMHGLTLLNEHPNAKKVKFYASGGITLRVLRRSFAELESDFDDQFGIKTSVYGNWAEFTKAA